MRFRGILHHHLGSGASLQALRVGNGRRIQYYPAHHKSEMIIRVPEQELARQVRAEAANIS